MVLVHPEATVPDRVVRRPEDVRYPPADDADVDVFHIGNHVELSPLDVGGPGTARRHCRAARWGLFDLMYPVFSRSAVLWERERLFEGVDDPDIRLRRQEPDFLLNFPFNGRVLKAADIVVVHTPWLRDIISARWPDVDVRSCPTPASRSRCRTIGRIAHRCPRRRWTP
jgi:hypothetical protein